MRKILLAVLFVGCVISAHLIPIRVFHSELLNGEFENLLHCLGFACITAIAYPNLDRLSRNSNRAKLSFVWTFLALIAVGVSAETTQLFFSRDASVLDLTRDAGGILTTLFMIASWKSKNTTTAKVIPRLWGAAAGIVALLCLLPFLAAAGAILLRNAASPVLFTFERRWENRFISPGDRTSLALLPPPFEWKTNRSRRAARTVFLGGTYPGITLDEVFPDWSRMQTLRLSIFLPMKEPHEIALRVHDRFHNNKYDDRFNTILHLVPGPNEFALPLTAIETAPRTRRMDMKHIESIVIFSYKPMKPFTIYLDNIVLE